MRSRRYAGGLAGRAARRRGVAHGSGLGRQRWVVERTLAWLHQFKRLRIRWEYRADIHEAFLKLACCLICWRRLQPAPRSRANAAVRPSPHTLQA
jgi:transposase